MGCDGDELGGSGGHVVSSAGLFDLVGAVVVEGDDEVWPCFHIGLEVFWECVWLDVETSGGDTACVFGGLVGLGGVFDDDVQVGEFDVVEAWCRVFPEGCGLGLVGEELEWVT